MSASVYGISSVPEETTRLSRNARNLQSAHIKTNNSMLLKLPQSNSDVYKSFKVERINENSD